MPWSGSRANPRAPIHQTTAATPGDTPNPPPQDLGAGQAGFCARSIVSCLVLSWIASRAVPACSLFQCLPHGTASCRPAADRKPGSIQSEPDRSQLGRPSCLGCRSRTILGKPAGPCLMASQVCGIPLFVGDLHALVHRGYLGILLARIDSSIDHAPPSAIDGDFVCSPLLPCLHCLPSRRPAPGAAVQ